MRKVILSLGVAALVAGCGATVYEADLNYYQDGNDCVYYHHEKGGEVGPGISALDVSKSVKFSNVKCSDLYKRDTFDYETRQERKVIVPASQEEENLAIKTMAAAKEGVESQCGCSKCGKKRVLKNRYMIVPAYVD